VTAFAPAVVETAVDGGSLRVTVLCDGTWQVSFKQMESTGRSLIPLLEGVLGRNHRHLVRHALDAFEAAGLAPRARVAR
jgi:hypothetical protein